MKPWPFTARDSARFWRHVDKTDGCWLEQLARLIDALDDELAPAAKARVLKKASGR